MDGQLTHFGPDAQERIFLRNKFRKWLASPSVAVVSVISQS